MSIADSDSSLHTFPPAAFAPHAEPPDPVKLPQTSAAGERAAHQLPARPEAIWLNGDVLACACPHCGAPMSIRLWLLLADCWHCGTSVELTEEQERQAKRLLSERESAVAAGRQERGEARGARVEGPALFNPEPAATASPVEELRSRVEQPAQPQPQLAPVSRRVPAASMPSRVRARLDDIKRHGEARLWASSLLKNLVCWLTSLIVHMVLIILLGLAITDESRIDRPLILATEMNPLDQQGNVHVIEEPIEAVEFDEPGLPNVPDASGADPFAGTEDTLEELNPFAGDPIGDDPDFEKLPELPGGPVVPGDLLRGREPRVREQLALREGGTTESEAAVARGLVWLAHHQSADGSWNLNGFPAAGDCMNRCDAIGVPASHAGTALGILPFLGAGITPERGEHALVVKRGLDWLVRQQGPDGDMRGDGLGQMYAHGMATIALCEAYALTRDESLREPAQRAINYIVSAQHFEGGWRYQPGWPGDTSVVGWQMMALRSGQMAYLQVPESVFANAARFLDSVQAEPSVAIYSYMPGASVSAAMTAEGLLCRQYSGWGPENGAMEAGVKWLFDNHPPHGNNMNMYYWYYGTQVMHHMGGQAWQRWNSRVRDMLVETQEVSGHKAGSWAPRVDHDLTGGRLYMTALAVCTLEVYYRHLPLYRGKAVPKHAKQRRNKR